MGSRHEVEVTLISGKDLKNVNWRHGDLKPYAVLWVDPAAKCSTKVDLDGDTNPAWDEKVTVPLGNRRIEDAVLSIDIVHANADKDTKPLIGSARISLREVVDEVGIDDKVYKTLKIKRPSGRPHGKLEVKIAVRESSRYYQQPPPQTYGSGYGQASARDLGGSYGYAAPYGAAPPPIGYPNSAPPQSGYPYGAPAPVPAYAQAAPYGQPAYGQPAYSTKKSGSGMGMGTGLAVGAAAGVLGGLAISEGVDYVEDKIADDVEERVVERLGGDDDCGYGGDDW